MTDKKKSHAKHEEELERVEPAGVELKPSEIYVDESGNKAIPIKPEKHHLHPGLVYKDESTPNAKAKAAPDMSPEKIYRKE